MLLSKPKFIAIDSSVLIGWTKDIYSNDSNLQNVASRALSQIVSDNWVFVITWHHFEELIKYSDESVVENRMRFIFNLPHGCTQDMGAPAKARCINID